MFRSNYRSTRPVVGTNLVGSPPYRGCGRADDTSNSFSRLPYKVSKTSHDWETEIRTAVFIALQENNNLPLETILDKVMEELDDDYRQLKAKQAQNGETKPFSEQILTDGQREKVEVIKRYYGISCRLLGLKKPTGRNTDYDRG